MKKKKRIDKLLCNSTVNEKKIRLFELHFITLAFSLQALYYMYVYSCIQTYV